MTTAAPTTTWRGGEWLLRAEPADAVFTPDRLNEEQRLIIQTVKDFVNGE